MMITQFVLLCNMCCKPPQRELTNPNYFEGGLGFGVWGFLGLNPVGVSGVNGALNRPDVGKKPK